MVIMDTVGREKFVSSIYEFWDTWMTDEEKAELVADTGYEDFEKHDGFDKWSGNYADIPSWLPEIFGGDDLAIESVLEKRKETFFIHLDERADGFIIWELYL